MGLRIAAFTPDRKLREAPGNYGSNIESSLKRGSYKGMKNGYHCAVSWALMAVMGTVLFAAAQTTYQPKFPGDPAHSESEAIALGYMRTVLRAQRLYNRKNNKYADSLNDLVHTGSFTRR